MSFSRKYSSLYEHWSRLYRSSQTTERCLRLAVLFARLTRLIGAFDSDHAGTRSGSQQIMHKRYMTVQTGLIRSEPA